MRQSKQFLTKTLCLVVLQCMEADDLQLAAGVRPVHSHFSVEDFMHVCPILIVQLDSHVCHDDDHDDHDDHGHGEEPPSWHKHPGAGIAHVTSFTTDTYNLLSEHVSK